MRQIMNQTEIIIILLLQTPLLISPGSLTMIIITKPAAQNSLAKGTYKASLWFS